MFVIQDYSTAVSTLQDISTTAWVLYFCPFFEFPFGYHIILKTKVIVEIWAHGHTATTKSGEDKHKGQAIMQIINTCKHNEILDRLSEPLQF